MNKTFKTALILGNGPSAKTVDFENIAMFDVFGMNAAYRYWHQIERYPDYYSCLDLVVGLSHKHEIESLISRRADYGIEKFLLRDNLIAELGVDLCDQAIINFDDIRASTRCFATRPVTTGSHTLAWAAALGYKNIFIIGVDCDYVQIIDEATLEPDGTLLVNENPKKAVNYFFDGYQQTGDRYNVPDPSADLHVSSWRNIASTLPKNVSVGNLNANSKMDAFEFSTWDYALAQASKATRSKPTLVKKLGVKVSGLFGK